MDLQWMYIYGSSMDVNLLLFERPWKDQMYCSTLGSAFILCLNYTSSSAIVPNIPESCVQIATPPTPISSLNGQIKYKLHCNHNQITFTVDYVIPFFNNTHAIALQLKCTRFHFIMVYLTCMLNNNTLEMPTFVY